MNEFTCPECGKRLIRGRDDFAAHALNHWGVGVRHIDRIPNSVAQERYRAIIAAESGDRDAGDGDTAGSGKIEIIEGEL